MEYLENDTEKKVGVETVRRALPKAGLGAIEKPKKPLLSAKNIRNRLSWYITHKDWTVDDWKRVIWSDETKLIDLIRIDAPGHGFDQGKA
ncbi:hypothetical protein G6F29_013758 [Rhizopus arrhizus]|nr:hypothetical protein G6F30_012454 [Rhizopus arrhizus]KAG0972011.1 hypothetical protein G6F29_013758 [Rhizopus arrhizus]KAG0974517.1 hypothetical protein G6F28_013217 [Rhizopus arrhizus]KAG1016532.1 hypothetical protein G6F26_012453 [Rhizopus arrhizus]KAG1028085.1 hypothetical protein G6F25_012473 [Rhizopus arrhizus]